MTLLRLQNFGGEVPVQGVRNLPDGFAKESVNTWLYSGELRALHPSYNLHAINPTTQKVFRIPLGTVGGDPTHPSVVPPPSYLGDSVWQQFTDPDTDIVRGPLVNDSFKRWYFCSPSQGPYFNTLARLQVGDPMYKLGVPNPIAVLGISISGGVATANVTRAYIYTFANIYGEESGPSPPVTASGKPDGVWAISNINDAPPPSYVGYAPVNKKVLYRTITAASGVTTFFKVAEIAVGTTTYNDDGSVNTDAIIAGNLQFDNANGTPPRSNMVGFVLMPNGFMIGWVDSTVCFSEPYKPHSWPPEYEIATEYPIVGLGVFGQSCAVCTQGFPGTIQGISPAMTAVAKSMVMEPCLSRGGIVNTPEAVYYPSPNGLCSISANGVNNITQTLITREEWQRDFTPTYLRSARYQQGYLALRAIDDKPSRTAFYFDLSDLRTAVTELSEFNSAENVQADVWSANVFELVGGQVKRHDPPDSAAFLPFRWKSKEFQYMMRNNFGCYEVFWDTDRFDATSTDASYIIAAGVPMHIRVWADRILIYDQDLAAADNSTMLRLPSGFKALAWQFEVSGRAPVFQFHVASTVKELRGA